MASIFDGVLIGVGATLLATPQQGWIGMVMIAAGAAFKVLGAATTGTRT